MSIGDNPASHMASRHMKAKRLLAIGFTIDAVARDCDLPPSKVREFAAQLRASRVPSRKQGDFRGDAIAELKAEGYSDEQIRAVFGE
jgi:hypothetical protein